MAPAPALTDLIAIVEADAGSSAALDRLSTASATASDLADAGDALLGHYVDQCRRAGHSWTEISAALGVTKQAAHKRFTLSAPALDRFTGRARSSLDAATTTAQELGHAFVGTEHLLLGLYDDDQSLSARVLQQGGLERAAVLEEVLAHTPRSTTRVDDPPLTPRAAESLAAALHEALALGHNYIGTEHLLLALHRDPKALAPRILTDAGLTHDVVRAAVVELLAGYTA